MGPRADVGGGEEKHSQPPPGIELPNIDRPARSRLLYRLNYRGSPYLSSTLFVSRMLGNVAVMFKAFVLMPL
jgi:hypothetical protein